MSILLLEHAAAALGPLCADVVFVGGASVTLWITDPGAPAPRPTKDVDVIVEVGSRGALHAFEERLRRQGFREDIDSTVICRWRHGDGDRRDDLVLDVIPADAALVGFTNRWFAPALPAAQTHALPSGAGIRAISPPYLLATKLDAFRGRGAGDYWASPDIEDIVMLVDGRDELVGEVAAADAGLRASLAAELTALLADRRFVDALYGLVRPDTVSQERVDTHILPRLRALAAG